LDCQVGDYGGWPEEEEESGGGLPLKVMTDEHWGLIVERCSEQKVRVCVVVVVVVVWFYKWYGESCFCTGNDVGRALCRHLGKGVF
jgi:hypothetical protein